MDEVVALTCSFTHPGEHRHTTMVQCNSLDHLLDEDGLADARTAKESDLSTLHIRSKQIDDLDPRLKHLLLTFKLVKRGRVPVNGPALLDVENLILLQVQAFACHIEDVALGHFTNRDCDWTTRVSYLRPAHQSISWLQCNGSHHVVTQMLGNFKG